MVFHILDDTGESLDAKIDVTGSEVVLDSRGGTKGKNSRNTEYGKALRLLLARLSQSNYEISGAWVVSDRTQSLPPSERQVLFPGELSDPSSAFTLASRRMQAVGSAAAKHGNSTKRLMIQLAKQPTIEQLTEILQLTAVDDAASPNGKIKAESLERVTAEYFYRAIAKADQSPMREMYGQSTKFDLLLDDGTRYPPKLIFGIAATEALGFEVKPKHFSAGWSQPCFNLLHKAGYEIVAKGKPAPSMSFPLTEDDRTWSEGSPKRVTHLRKERASGLAEAKKAEFLRLHGKLFCESCGLDPVSKFGPQHGPSLIEVHHDANMVANMVDGHLTRLSDLKRLCANCHRLEHSKLKANLRSDREN